MIKDSYHVAINEHGRVTIPAAVRQAFGLKAGDTLVLTVEPNALRLSTYQRTLQGIQQELKGLLPPGAPLASETLIAERREEARQEAARWGSEHAGRPR